jgi:haloalkane dehalogenase
VPAIDVLDSTMYFEDLPADQDVPADLDLEDAARSRGSATSHPTAIVFLHGNPSSSYLWRNVLPRIAGSVRRIAPDLIGMGRSGKPDIPYRFDDHSRYLDALFDELGLEDVVLVGHDWGGALAFDWAARHPGRTRGIAFLETIVRPMLWAEFPAASRGRFESFRAPGTGERMVLDENVFLEGALRSTVLSALSDADLDAYRAPYPTPGSRRALLEWPRAMPLDGEPADVVGRIRAYDEWLAESTDVPKLIMTFDASPTLIIGPELIAWCEANIANLENEYCGAAGHLAPEDQPDAIVSAINRWLDRQHLVRDATAHRAA